MQDFLKTKFMFRNDPINIKNFTKGYITDGDEYPPDSVQGCKNLDFRDGETSVRPPYSVLKDMDGILPSGYTIKGFTEKNFTDAAGNIESVIIVVACHSSPDSSHPAKIYVSKFFNPASTYFNYTGAKTNQIGSTDWEDNYTELTEKVSFTAGSPSYSDSNRVNTVTCTITAQKTNYYKGWFVYDGSDNCIGCVAYYNGSTQLVVRLNSYNDSGTLTLRTMAAGTYYLCRFPVTIKLKSAFESVSISKVNFQERGNTVIICLGREIQLLNLSFLQQKKFFGNQGDIIGSGNDALYKNWNGFWLTKDAPEIANKKVYINHDITSAGTTSNKYISSDIADLGIIVKYDINTTTSSGNEIIGGSVVCTIDGYQGIFLKNIILGKTASWINEFDYISVYFQMDFERRLTDFNLFWGRFDNFKDQIKGSYDQEIFDTYQLFNANGGKVSCLTEHSGIPFSGHNVYETWLLDIDISTGNIPTGYAYNLAGLTTGTSLNSYLNNFYWKDIHTKADDIIKIGDNMMAINLANDVVSTDSDYDMNGQLKVALSQVQQGIISATSIFVDERVKQIPLAENLIGGVETIDDKFLLFTENTLLYYEVADAASGLLRKNQDFRFRGAYSKKDIVRAQLGNQFAGVYWKNNISIYRFLDDHPENILSDRWELEYQKMSESDKQNGVSGFLPRTRDVFFVIGSKIYLWNILKENWRIYEYDDVPQYIVSALSGELYYSNSRTIYQTEGLTSSVYKDKDLNGIDWSWKKTKMSHGSKIMNKVFDRIDMYYDVQAASDVDALMPVSMDVKVTGNDGAAGYILNKTYELQPANATKQSKIVVYPEKRNRVNKYSVEVSSSTDVANMQKLTFNEIIINAKIAQRFGRKI